MQQLVLLQLQRQPGGGTSFGSWLAQPMVNQGNPLVLEEAWDIISGLGPGEIGIDATCGTGPNGEVYREPAVWMYDADNGPVGPMAPATVSWPYHCGRVGYTVYHTVGGGGSSLLLQEKIMMYLILRLQSCAVGPCDWAGVQ